jgi:hypothetical protein
MASNLLENVSEIPFSFVCGTYESLLNFINFLLSPKKQREKFLACDL